MKRQETAIATSVTRKVAVPDEGIESLYGSLDENLKHLEQAFGVRISTGPSELIIEGDAGDAGRAERVLDQLTDLLRDGYRFAKGDVRTAVQLVKQDADVDLQDYFKPDDRGDARDAKGGAAGPGRPVGRKQIAPKTVNQKKYLDAIEKHDIVFGVGPAGTGKTYLAMAQAVSFLLAKKVTRIIMARPAVEAGERLGFLPGDLQEKVNPYLRPLYDALYDMLEVERVARLLERGIVEVAPIAFMRGRTLNDAFVILDEAQNTTSEQMKMFLTRLGFGSKAVITGDITQIDLPAGKGSGLVEALKVVRSIDGIAQVYFDDKDVVRHTLVQQIVKAYEAFSPEGAPRNAPPR
jgi:phosphate starvation-inducible PhoH-like protein